jgi:hypothetical protein
MNLIECIWPQVRLCFVETVGPNSKVAQLITQASQGEVRSFTISAVIGPQSEHRKNYTRILRLSR